MEVVANIIGGFFLGYANCYIAYNLLEEKMRNDIYTILLIFSYSFLIVANYSLIDNAFRLITGLLILIVVFKIMFEKNLYKTIILSVGSYVLIAISELTFAIFCLVFLQIDPTNLMKYMAGNLISNLMIAIVLIAIYRLTKDQIKHIIIWCDYKKDKMIIAISIISLLFIGSFFFNTYNDGWRLDFIFFINVAAVFTFCLLMLRVLRERSNNNNLIVNHNQLLEYVKTIETLIEDYRKIQHEHLNQLAIIKDLDKRSSKVYIDNLIHSDKHKKYNWANYLAYVPNGGLKGLLYYKVTIMKKQNIEVVIDINDDLKELSNNKNAYVDICRIVGIYLDNAIEATSTLETKEVIIEIYKRESKTQIIISNTFAGTIEIDRIFHSGYSTKGSNRGLGLSIVNELTDRNQSINKNTKIVNNYFIQELIIEK